MNLVKILKGEPVATMSVVTAFIGVLALLGIPKEVTGPIVILIGAVLAFPVRSNVAPLTHVVSAVRAVAENAASGTAAALDKSTVGLTGEVTASATSIVSEAASLASNLALADIGVKKH